MSKIDFGENTTLSMEGNGPNLELHQAQELHHLREGNKVLALRDLLPLCNWALGETSPPGIDEPLVEAASIALAAYGADQ